MFPKLRRRLVPLAAAVALVSFAGTGCYGKFALVKKVYDWNGTIENKFLRSLVMFAFVIIPVYELSSLGDYIIFNVIEFWGGTNPIAMKEGEVREKVATVEGKRVKMTVSDLGARLRIEVDGKQTLEARVTEHGAVAFDGNGALLASVELGEDGGARVRDERRGTVREVTPARVEAVAAAAQSSAGEMMAALQAERGSRVASSR
jgi:hypothetical protein